MGSISRHIRRPLLWCAVFELIIAIYGLSSDILFSWAEQWYGIGFRRHEVETPVLWVYRGTLLALLLALPTFLMGGTLPLYCRRLISQESIPTNNLGFIYGINTLGGTAGCLIAGFMLIPHLGAHLSTLAAVALNVGVALGFYWLDQYNPIQMAGQQPVVPDTKTNSASNNVLLARCLIFAIGAIALANELIWARFLTFFIRNTVYTYSLALGVVLFGMAAGSLLFGRYLQPIQQPSRLLGIFALAQLISAVSVQTLTHLPPVVWVGLKSMGYLTYGLIMLPSSLAAGLSFPLIVNIAGRQNQILPRELGIMTFCNITGCVMGSLLTGYFLLPAWGLDFTVLLASGAAVLAALWAISAMQPFRKALVTKRFYRNAAAFMAIWLGVSIFSPLKIPEDLLVTEEKILAVKEGYNSNLAVVERKGVKTLLIDNLWQGVAGRNYQVMVAHVPMLHYPQAKDLLVIGLGTGTTASRFLNYDIAHLDIVDIEPRLFSFVRTHFDSNWMNDPRVNFKAIDGRNYVKHSASQYDFISVEIGQLDRPGVGVFYTDEFYREVRAKLRPDGMIAQFVPLRFLSDRQFSGVLKTFLANFPQAKLWYNTNELLLLGFKNAIKPLSVKSYIKASTNPATKQDFNFNYWGGGYYSLQKLEVFLAGYLASGPELQALVNVSSTGEIFSDDKLQLSYLTQSYRQDSRQAAERVPQIQQHLSAFSDTVADTAIPERLLAKAAEIRRFNVLDMAATEVLDVLEHSPYKHDQAVVYDLASQAVKWNPKNLRALAILDAAYQQLNPDVPE